MNQKRRPGRPRTNPVVVDRECVICGSLFQLEKRFKSLFKTGAKTCSRQCQLVLTAQTLVNRAKSEGFNQ